MTRISKIFGPVPSRRLGRSLGINNIPPKCCNYDCIYCQLGRTLKRALTRLEYYNVSELKSELIEKIHLIKQEKLQLDYITFVADGEPTLDLNLGKEIQEFKQLGYKLALITNSSLLSQKEVREEISNLDWISVKIDAVSMDIWRKMNRPIRRLNLPIILEGITQLRKDYEGTLCTETMMVRDMNDNLAEIEKIAGFIQTISPDKSYLSIPIRPPAEKSVQSPSESSLNYAYNKFLEKGINVEFLIGYEGNEFSSTGNLEEDILNIASVHPMKHEALDLLLKKYGYNWNFVDYLIESKKVVQTEYKNEFFYIRNFNRK